MNGYCDHHKDASGRGDKELPFGRKVKLFCLEFVLNITYACQD